MVFSKYFLFVSLAILFLILGCDSVDDQLEIGNLTCELSRNPRLITKTSPRLGWQLSSEKLNLKQAAYQVKVFSDKEKVKIEQADIWDSEKVNSEESQYVEFAGEKLEYGRTYYWKVRVWDKAGNSSAWSAISEWKMAPKEIHLDASWIGAIRRENSNLPKGRDYHTPTLKKEKRQELIDAADSLATRSIMLRNSFYTKKAIKNAEVYISGLGHYELTLNGKKVGDSEFAPLWTDYDKTVYYNSYDVTESLFNGGENVIGVILGNGMYNVLADRYSKFFVSFGPPTLFVNMKIHYQDGTEQTVRSDDSWKYSKSPITYNSIFGGENYDANLEQEGWDEPEFNDETWKMIVMQDAPKGVLKPQQAPPVKIEREYGVAVVNEPEPGVYVLNMGQNLSGFPTIKVKGEKGDIIRVWVGEYLKDDGTVGQGRSGGPYYYEYTLKGEGEEEWQPKFSYYGFQYVQVSGVNYKNNDLENDLPTLLDVKSNFVFNSAGTNGSFECSNEIFNRAHQLINNSIKSNFQSIFTDCPHREKLGWLEETHLNGPGLFYNYNLQSFIPKVMQDMRDAQRENGLIPNIAPEYIEFGGDFTDSPEWGVAGIVLPWMYYEYYGDSSIIEENYEMMKRYVDYLSTTAENNIVSHGLGDWYDYGDHAAGYSKNSPIALSATSHYFMGADLVAKAADILGKEEDKIKYETLAKEIRNSFNEEFFDKETAQYGTSSQFSNAVPIFMGIVEQEYKNEVMKNLLEDIKARGFRLTTGDVGNRYLFQALARNDQNEVMYKMHNHYDAPGYGFQIEFGLTTLTEQWDPRKGNSWNHFMMGQIEEWFYRSLGGIVPDIENPGFKHFFLQPEVVGNMEFVSANYESIYGKIVSNWRREGDTFYWILEIPANTTATIKLPGEASGIQINGEDFDDSDLVLDSVLEKKASFILGSGKYEIKSRL